MFSDIHDWEYDRRHQAGVEAGLQIALNVIIRAIDWLQAHPENSLGMVDVLDRIITDIQAAPIQ